MNLFSRDAKMKERHIRQPVIQASQNCGGDKDDIQKHIIVNMKVLAEGRPVVHGINLKFSYIHAMKRRGEENLNACMGEIAFKIKFSIALLCKVLKRLSRIQYQLCPAIPGNEAKVYIAWAAGKLLLCVFSPTERSVL